MFIIKNKIWFFVLTGLFVLAAIASILFYGLKFGTDFTGGALVEVNYANGRPAKELLMTALQDAKIEEPSLREAGASEYIMRSHVLTTAQQSTLQSVFSIDGKTAQITQMTEVGPTIGQELRSKSIVALFMVLAGILLFIAFAFRKVSKPISSWVYGFIALVTLIHDVIIPVGFFAALSHFLGAEIDTLFVTAVLTVLGFSIHDTIVVFDRVRENLRRNEDKGRKEPFWEVAGRSLNQTFVRSVNTSLTVVITLSILYWFGPKSTEFFSLTLLVGIIAGTYSSIFLATPLLVAVEEWQKQPKAKR